MTPITAGRQPEAFGGASTTLPTGTEIHNHTLCPRKLWWFTRGIEHEHVAISL